MNKKLFEAYKAMGNPLMDATGQIGQRRYQYASLASVLKVVRPALAEQGLMLTQGVSYLEGDKPFLVTKVADGEGAETVLDVRAMHENANAQHYGSYETYMRRYALLTVFGLVGDEDDDGVATTPQEAQASQDEAAAAGKYLSDAITKYCAATGADSNQTRLHIKEKLAMTNEASSPAALRREADNLLLTLKTLNLDG